jgi:hypothetical protein
MTNDGVGKAMTETEAQKLLTMYADGLLEEAECKEIEAVIRNSPKLQIELSRLQALRKSGLHHPVSGRHSTATPTGTGLSDDMLMEALAPLRPSRSSRMKVADAMRAVHAQAQYVANTMPETKWRMARLLFCLAAACVAVWIAWMNLSRPSSSEAASIFFSYASGVIFTVGILLTLAGRPLASIEARILSAFSKRDLNPSRLEVLVVEIFGVCLVLGSALIYWLVN